jgi:hypothetical protein
MGFGRCFCAGALLLCSALSHAGADDTYLDALLGRWTMTGTLLGKPVRYHAEAERVLQGGFLRLHMLDAVKPPQYEAALYLGYDAKAHDFIAHWLDKFGAAGARVVASGKREGETLILQFPYAEGAFRDTLQRDAQRDSWTLRIEAQGKDGSWSNFASYAFKRKPIPMPNGTGSATH